MAIDQATRLEALVTHMNVLLSTYPDALVEGCWDEFVFGFARLERVMDLLAHVPLEAEPLGDRQRLHELPGSEVRAAEVADLSLLDEPVERTERLVHARLPVPPMHLVEVDAVDLQSPEALIAGAQKVVA